jgi:preprotein translocase subunit SecD
MRLSALVVSVAFLLGIAGCDSEGKDETASVVLRSDATLTEQELDRARDVMEVRVQKLGLDGATIERRGRDLVAELPRGRVEEAVAVLSKQGNLEVFDLQGDLLGTSIDDQGYPRASTSRLRADENSVILRCSRPSFCPGAEPVAGGSGIYYYRIRYRPDDRRQPAPELTGADFELGTLRQEYDQLGDPIVLLQLTPGGVEKFRKMTRELAERGRLQHNRAGGEPSTAYQHVAIVVDRRILSAPTVDFQTSPQGISAENGVQISGIGSVDEVRELAIALQSGELPAPFHRVNLGGSQSG